MKKEKILVFLLAVIMLTSLFVSCKKEPEGSNNGDGGETVADSGRLAELGKKDFSGKVFTVLDANDYPEMHVNYATEETRKNSNISEVLYLRDIWLIETYNLDDIKYVPIMKAADGCNALRTQNMAGVVEYDMVISTAIGANASNTGGTLAALSVQEMLKNLNEINYLSPDKEWWSPLIYEQMTINDKLYFTTGDIAPSLYQAPAAMYVNMDLLKAYHEDTDIFKIVEDGEWTFEQLLSLSSDISDDVNSDNVMSATDDFFGIVMFKNGLNIQEFVIGAGLNFSKVDNNNLTMDLKSETLGNLIDTIKDLYPTMPYNYGAGNDQQNVVNITFKNGKALFLAQQLEGAMFHLRDMEGDYAVLPYPKFDNTQTRYLSLVNHWCDCFVAVPSKVSDDRMEFVGFMMEAMAAYSRDNLYPFIYESVLKYQRVNDPQSSAMIDVIMDGIVIDYAVCHDIGELSSTVLKAVFDDTPLSTLAITQKGNINKSIKEILKAHGVEQ